jgi:hypothetical protein
MADAAAMASMTPPPGPAALDRRARAGVPHWRRVCVNKMPAARMGDLCAHGGVIVGGHPTVLIG